VRVNRGGNFRLRQRIQLVEEEDGRVRILAAPAFRAQFVADPTLFVEPREAAGA